MSVTPTIVPPKQVLPPIIQQLQIQVTVPQIQVMTPQIQATAPQIQVTVPQIHTQQLLAQLAATALPLAHTEQ